jgi:hypothetical protein
MSIAAVWSIKKAAYRDIFLLAGWSLQQVRGAAVTAF